MIAIVDYGRGNLGSVQKALARVAADVVITDDRATVERARALVVPGDGAFADAMQSLERLGLAEPIRAHIAAGRPYLGICLGYQLLFTESEEFGHAKGLDVLPGVVRRFPVGLKVPHMGWNQLRFAPGELPMLAGVPDGAYVYFVHSYYPEPADLAACAFATCEYGVRFPALLARGALYGTQFHPEKSQGWGLRLLENFARLAGLIAEDARP
ncbi:MAG TPA: imidazole glycerol phosphate synthase subunit HisH [Methylomirabilota bacterium]|jgi:glutamine amidotransferase|nr:imidazole glycerol phosphate synthase subunit HisH [Methylomirabilota bacterium]